VAIAVGKVVAVTIGAQTWLRCAVDGCGAFTRREGDVLCSGCRDRADKWGEYGFPLPVLAGLLRERDRTGRVVDIYRGRRYPRSR